MKKTKPKLLAKFKQFRKRTGLTQEKLAKRLGITRSMVANYENRSLVPPDIAKHIEEKFKDDPACPVTKEYFLWP